MMIALKMLHLICGENDMKSEKPNLFGRYCEIPTGQSAKPFIYRIISSDTRSNGWSEIPLTYNTETQPIIHDYSEDILFVVSDGIIDETSRIIRVALKDVKLKEQKDG